MTRFLYRLQELLRERGMTTYDIRPGCGVARETVYREIRSRATVAALAYLLQMDAAELVRGTELEELWAEGLEEK